MVRERVSPASGLKSGLNIPAFAWPALGAIFLLWATLQLGMVQFGGMDGSAVIQAAWRYHLGQVPYVDFKAVAPPSYIVIPGMAFNLLGVRWSSLVDAAAIFSTGAFLLQYWMLRRLGWSLKWSFTTSLAAQVVTMLPLSWWSYNQATGASTVLFATAVFLLARKPGSRLNQAAVVLTMIILSWMKPNVAGLMLAGASVALLINPRTRFSYAICAAVATVVSVAALVCCRVSPAAMLGAYMSSSGRLGSLTMLGRCLWWSHPIDTILTLIPIALLLSAFLLKGSPLSAPRPRPENYSTYVSIAFIAIAASLFGSITDNEDKGVEAAALLCGVTMLLIDPIIAGAYRSETWRTHLVEAHAMTGTILLITAGLIYSVSRERIEGIGRGSFFEDVPTVEVPRAGSFFDGLSTGPRLMNVLSEVEATLKAHDVTDKTSVFFGPRMEFGYATWGFTPRKGQFLWWPGTGETPQKDIDAVAADFVAWHPKLCIFLINDFTYMPYRLLSFLGQQYDIKNEGNLTVLTAK